MPNFPYIKVKLRKCMKIMGRANDTLPLLKIIVGAKSAMPPTRFDVYVKNGLAPV